MTNLDPSLFLLLREKEYFDNDPSLGIHPVPDEREIPVGLVFTGDFEAIRAAGFRGSPVMGETAFGFVDIKGLRALAGNPQVVRVSPRPERSLQLNDSIPDIEANKVWTRSGNTFTGYTGKGVIIGIIDSGIDITHPVFKTPDGKSRILYIWDQTIISPVNPPKPGENPPGSFTNPLLGNITHPLNYGVEYNNAQIQQTLDNPSNLVCRHKDVTGHGTHVAGIAGGNGSQGGDCFGPYRYIGVAPEASFIIVRVWGMSPGDLGEDLDPPQTVASPSGDVIVDALVYIVNKARPSGSSQPPLAINISIGSFSSKMDGSTPSTVLVDLLLAQPACKGIGVAVCAGNFAKYGFHIKVSVPANDTLMVPLQIIADDRKERHVTLYFTGTTIQATITSPYHKRETVSAGPPSATANGDGSAVSIGSPNPGEIAIGIKPPPGGTNLSGTWNINLTNSGSTPVTVDGYCEDVGDMTPKVHFFSNKDQLSPLSTLAEMACGVQSIAVGDYAVSKHALADVSGRGPTRGGAPNKPDLCAPGEDVKSAGGSIHCSCCCTCCQHWYVSNHGTSMSTPHVAGTIALMLHKNPQLTNDAIRDALINSNHTNPPPSGTSADDLQGWGAGRLDAKKAVDAVTAFNAPVEAPDMIQAPEHAASLQEQFLRTPNGKRLAELFHRYFPEIMDLVNHNRRVATIWHRCKGPVWTRLAMQAFYNPGLRVLPEIDGLSLPEAAARFMGILQRYASAALLGEFKPFEPLLAGFSREMTLSEMILLVGDYKTERLA